jgi:hypothetical protein
MGNDWRPISELQAGHYAVGLLADDGTEADIYRAGDLVLDVATGLAVIVAVWQPREHAPCLPIS